MPDPDTLIERKIDGKLPPEEHRHFERLLQVDPAFAQAYADQQTMIALFRQHQKEALHQQLEAGYQTYRKNRAVRNYYGIAASLLLMLLGGWVWWHNSSNRLFKTFYQPYEVISFRGTILAQENQATGYYKQGRYTEALPLLYELQQTGENQDYWTLLRGNAYLQVDSTAQARAQFEQMAHATNHAYQQYGRWYEALSYLKENRRSKAQSILQSIASRPGLFQRKAQQLLNEL